MYKITIKGKAGRSYPQINDRSKFDGVDCQDCFSEYFSEAYRGRQNEQPLIDKGVKGGYMRFKWENDELYVIVDYTSKEKLTEDELEILKDYTQGQMSDGIGEGFEQYPCYFEGDVEYCLSPWYHGQELTATQKETKKVGGRKEEEEKIKWYKKGEFEDDEKRWENYKDNQENLENLIKKVKKLLDDLKN